MTGGRIGTNTNKTKKNSPQPQQKKQNKTNQHTKPKDLYTSGSIQPPRKPQLLFKNKFIFLSTVHTGRLLGKKLDSSKIFKQWRQRTSK